MAASLCRGAAGDADALAVSVIRASAAVGVVEEAVLRGRAGGCVTMFFFA